MTIDNRLWEEVISYTGYQRHMNEGVNMGQINLEYPLIMDIWSKMESCDSERWNKLFTEQAEDLAKKGWGSEAISNYAKWAKDSWAEYCQAVE